MKQDLALKDTFFFIHTTIQRLEVMGGEVPKNVTYYLIGPLFEALLYIVSFLLAEILLL